jgi:TonB-dependent starch-binding outer membrane protein SusC
MKLRFFFVFLFAFLLLTDLTGQKNNKKIIVSGTVTDINNKPVAGAWIFVDKKSTNKITNYEGFYKVRIKPDKEMIGVSIFQGRITELPVAGKTEINFSLPVDITKVEAIIQQDPGEEEINIGYGTVKRKNMTTSVGRVDNKQNKYSTYLNIYDMLRGEVPGVQVYGKSSKIQGASSFIASTEPLLVVDGVAVSTIDDIQPRMVKSIEVLKGSAATIYGARGANGVILITLKSSGDFK